MVTALVCLSLVDFKVRMCARELLKKRNSQTTDQLIYTHTRCTARICRW